MQSSLLSRHPIALPLSLLALILVFTTDGRTFGLLTDGQVMTRTAFSMSELGEVGMAQGHKVNIVRPEGDAVSRYGMGPSLAQVPVFWLAPSFEKSFGFGSSQALFVAEQILWVLLAAVAAGFLVRSLGGEPRDSARAVFVTGIASPLWAYTSSDFSEPFQAAVVGGAFALAVRATGAAGVASTAGDERSPRPRRRVVLAALAGAACGLCLLAKSILVVLLPGLVVYLFLAGPREGGVGRALAALAGWLPLAVIWTVFEVVRFGKPFASYQGERFSHPIWDGLWRLTVGPNKGLFVYFPLALLAVWGLVVVWRRSRETALALAGFSLFLLGTTSAWWSWDGTAGWGPRLLIPLVPLLAALAVVAARSTKPVVFWTLFAAGFAVNLIGVLQPDSATSLYYQVLPGRKLTAAETRHYPAFAVDQVAPDGSSRLLPLHDAASHVALSPIRLSLWLLEQRLSEGDILKALQTPPWRTDIPGQEVAQPPEKALEPSLLPFLTSRFRWPYLGLALFRNPRRTDFAFAFLDSVYDQTLRAQDMRQAERAVVFGERLYTLMPGPQAAVAWAEGQRLAGRKEGFREFLKEIPKAHQASPEFGAVVSFWLRDQGDALSASATMQKVARSAPVFPWTRLVEIPPSQWPFTLREAQRATSL